jgi:hypothetical protein
MTQQQKKMHFLPVLHLIAILALAVWWGRISGSTRQVEKSSGCESQLGVKCRAQDGRPL